MKFIAAIFAASDDTAIGIPSESGFPLTVNGKEILIPACGYSAQQLKDQIDPLNIEGTPQDGRPE